MRNVCITKFNDFIPVPDKDNHLGQGNTYDLTETSVIQYMIVGNEICPSTNK